MNNGSKLWYLNGKLHRKNGPAIISAHGSEKWYLGGVEFTFNEWLEKVKISEEEKLLLILKFR
jgi:hypothetical protein